LGPTRLRAHIGRRGDVPLAVELWHEGAEVDAFSAITLERVIVQPGASISFGSGTQYLVTTVPEPGMVALWLAGLAVLAGSAARRRAAWAP
jgi:PEP-CTERM motif